MEKRHSDIFSFIDTELPKLNIELKDIWDRISWVNRVSVSDATAAPTGGANGELRLQDDGTNKVLWIYVVSSWVNIGDLISAIIDHTHSSTSGEGGQLDWDDIWDDAIHSHQNNAEGGTIDHGATTGKGDDDHTLYLLADGIRNLTGDLLVTSTNKIQFFDIAIHIQSADDGHLDLTADVSIDLNSPVIDLSGQTVDVTLNNAVDALNFDSNTLSIDASNNRVGIGTALPGSITEIKGNTPILIIADNRSLASWTPKQEVASIEFHSNDTSGILGAFAKISGTNRTTSSNYPAGRLSFQCGLQGQALTETMSIERTKVKILLLELESNLTIKAIANSSLTLDAAQSYRDSIIYFDAGGGALRSGSILVDHDGASNNQMMIFSIGANTERMRITGVGSVGISTITPDRLLHIEVSDAVTDANVPALRLSHVGTGTKAIDFATSIEFELEGADGTNLVCGEIETVWTDASTGAEDADMIFKVSTGGAVASEVMKIIGADKSIKAQGVICLPKVSGNGIKVDVTTPTFGWRDLRAEIRTRGVGGTDPNDTTYIGNVKAYSFAVNDEAWIEFHIPHDYVAGTDIHLHFHWSHNSAIVTGGSITIGADVTYAKGHNQAPFSVTVNPTLSPNASTTQYQHMVSEVRLSASTPGAAQIDTDDLEPDGLILARVYLSANNITSSGAVPDPFIHEVDIHYQSTNIATKQNVPDFYA